MTEWIQRVTKPGAAARVVCLPRAGGSARDFDSWRAGLGEQVELCAAQLPGRLDRFREPALDDLGIMAAQVAAAIQQLNRLPYLLFGDCMGALVAFETARVLRAAGAGLPGALVVASYPAPDGIRTERSYHDAPPAEFRQRLRDVGGLPPSALADDELFDLLLPTLRADFAAFERYRYRPEPPLELDIHAMAGAQDPFVAVEVLESWRDHTSREFSLSAFPGGHFFLRDSAAAVSRVRALALAATDAPACGPPARRRPTHAPAAGRRAGGHADG